MLKQMMGASDADEAHKKIEHHKLESMLGFTEITTCRRQALLKYFDDHLEQPCGNCDTCLAPVETWDATIVAQKALSCVYKTNQRFGVTYLVDVLLGKDMARIKQFGHDQISVYGIGKEMDAKQWRSIYRQLIARNFLSVDIEGHGNLRLTEQCRPVLRGEETLHLRKESKQAKSSQRGRKTFNNVKNTDNALWEALRACRKTLADESNVPPYVIFHDATLMEMVERQPQTHDQFSKMTGVGKKKLEAYANPFLEVIKQHINAAATSASNDTMEETLLLLRSGMNANEIAAHRNLKAATIYGHLARSIELGEVEVQQVVDLSEKEIRSIQNAFLNFSDEDKKLKPVYEAFEGAFDYGLLQCVRASIDIPV